MADLIILPVKHRMGARRPAGRPAATVAAFPSARHVRIVANVARTMTEFCTIDAAERHLMWHLNVYWSRLEKFGVAEDAIEAECRAFAIAAWRKYQQTIDRMGAA
jgi:hypothetical protein